MSTILPFVMEWLVAGGSLLTMLFGVYGLGVKARDDDGKLTRRGLVVLAGVVVSGLIAFTSNTWQIYSKRISAERESARFSRLLSSVERTTYATKDGLISVVYEIDLNRRDFLEYETRLARAYWKREQACKKLRDNQNEVVAACDGYQWQKSEAFGEDRILFDLKSSLAPNTENEWAFHQFIRFVGAGLLIDEGRTQGPQKMITAMPADIIDKLTLWYSSPNKLHVSIVDVPLVSLGTDNFSITSLSDMLGKEIRTSVFWDRRACHSDPNTRDMHCMQSIMRPAIAVKRLVLQFPHGVSIELLDERDGVTPEDGPRYLSRKIGTDPSKLDE